MPLSQAGANCKQSFEIIIYINSVGGEGELLVHVCSCVCMLCPISKEEWLSLPLGGKSLVQCPASASLGSRGEAWYYVLPSSSVLCDLALHPAGFQSTRCGIACVSGDPLVHSFTRSFILSFSIYMVGSGAIVLELHDE